MIDTMDKHSCELFLEDALEIGRRLVETVLSSSVVMVALSQLLSSGSVRCRCP